MAAGPNGCALVCLVQSSIKLISGITRNLQFEKLIKSNLNKLAAYALAHRVGAPHCSDGLGDKATDIALINTLVLRRLRGREVVERRVESTR